MKGKWDERVYLELYAGSGFAKIKHTARIIAGSPIRALLLEHPFDKYIFCERQAIELDSLKQRVERIAPSRKVSYILGDWNERVDEILAEIPAYSSSHRVLSLCFVDPFDIGIKFGTIRRLSERYMDFLVLLAFYMDANRNIDNHVREEAVKIDEFLGSSTWRDRWNIRQRQRNRVSAFLAEEFSSSMETLGYQRQPFYKMKRRRRHSISRGQLANNSKIEWTDATWNPVRGCTKISTGCKHCYAETFAERFRGVKGHPHEQGFDLKLVPEKLTEPFAWRSPKLVFVNSMSDLFQSGVPDAYVQAVAQVMTTANWHTYQVLTKRSQRLRDLLGHNLEVAATAGKHLVGR
jgi:three-Cys-motif partner protein